MNVKEFTDFQFPIKLSYGKIALETLPSELRIYGSRKPLVLFSVDAMIMGLPDLVAGAFNESEMTIGVYDSVPEIPSLKIIKELSDIYIKNGHDAIIAVGSGAVMSIAKVLNISVSLDNEKLKTVSGKNKIKNPLKPFFVVPTASGTGGLANGFAEVDNLTFSSHFLIPDYAVLDPGIIGENDVESTADIALRALAITSEAYTLPDSNCFIDPYAYLAIQTIMDNLIDTVKNIDANKKWVDYLVMSDLDKGRLGLTTAAILGGFTSFYVPESIVCRLGEALNRVSGVPSGICMGILLPYGLEYNREKNGYRTAELLLALKGSDMYSRTPEEKRSAVSIGAIQGLFDNLFDISSGGIPRTLANLGLSDQKLDKVAEIASEGRDEDSKEDCLHILKNAASGTFLSN